MLLQIFLSIGPFWPYCNRKDKEDFWKQNDQNYRSRTRKFWTYCTITHTGQCWDRSHELRPNTDIGTIRYKNWAYWITTCSMAVWGEKSLWHLIYRSKQLVSVRGSKDRYFWSEFQLASSIIFINFKAQLQISSKWSKTEIVPKKLGIEM